MTFDVDQQSLGIFIILGAVLLIAAGVYKYLNDRLDARAEREIEDDFQEEMGRHARDPYDGDTYAYNYSPDWPETGLAAYLDQPVFVPSRPQRPPLLQRTAGLTAVRPLPFPVPPPPLDAEAGVAEFMDSLRRRADHAIAQMYAPLP